MSTPASRCSVCDDTWGLPPGSSYQSRAALNSSGIELSCRSFRCRSMLSADPLCFEWPPGFQSLRDIQPWRHTLAFSQMRLRVDAFPGMQVCAAEWRASERSGDDRSRWPFEYSGPAEQSALRRGREGQLGERPSERSGLRLVPNQVVNRRVRDGRCRSWGESACDVPRRCGDRLSGCSLKSKRAAKRTAGTARRLGFCKSGSVGSSACRRSQLAACTIFGRAACGQR